VRCVRPPEVLWRVGRAPSPLTPSRTLKVDELARKDAGFRFDSATALFRVLYAGTTLDACFGETLAIFRPDLDLIALIGDEWRNAPGFMNIGAVPQQWRDQRLAAEFQLNLAPFQVPDESFVDLEDMGTLQDLRDELAGPLASLGYKDIDVGLIRGGDRRVTRLISDWVFEQTDSRGRARHGGMRFLSRLNSRWECWAIFEDVPIKSQTLHPITLDMKALERVAKAFGLRVF
jgi:hypothetical protein